MVDGAWYREGDGYDYHCSDEFHVVHVSPCVLPFRGRSAAVVVKQTGGDTHRRLFPSTGPDRARKTSRAERVLRPGIISTAVASVAT